MKIDALKIHGFKSFADAVEMPIGGGITGIVGPNGCGKSNLIESFRWAMGETAPSRVRADGMDDVIFGGTDLRPPRSTAEVVVVIDNAERLAPVDFNNDDKLEVSRKIVRGDGTSYKVNGKAARARDVQILFKDAGVGAGSSALVSQGKVASIINAKPSERRVILEEAAGVTGITARKKEAESKLRATEHNLERAEDLERGLSDQLQSLRSQARKARRRKDIDGLIRAAEAQVFLVRWNSSSARVEQCDIAFKSNEETIKELMIGHMSAEAALVDAEKANGPLIEARINAETAFALAKAKVETVRKEAQAARNALSAAQRAIERTRADLEREKASIGNSGDEYEDLKDRKAQIEDGKNYDSVLIEEASLSVEEARETLVAVSLKVQAMSEALSVSKTERSAVERRLSDTKGRLTAVQMKLSAGNQKILDMKTKLDALPSVGEDITVLSNAVASLDDMVAVLTDDLSSFVDDETVARTNHGMTTTKIKVVQSELVGLRDGQPEENTAGSRIDVQDGYEKAFAAALSDGLGAGLGVGEQRWWEVAAARIDHPIGSKPLKAFGKVPPEVDAAVSAVGIMAVEDITVKVVADLKPGQSIVTLAGDLVRWDGYRTREGDGAAEAIRRAARLRALEQELHELTSRLDRDVEALNVASGKVASKKAELEDARGLSKARRSELEQARSKLAATERERLELQTKIETALVSQGEYAEQVEIEQDVLIEIEEMLGALPDPKAEEELLRAGKADQSKLNGKYEAARTELDKVKRDAEARVLQLQNIDQQMSDFDKRLLAAKDRVKELEARFAEANLEVEDLAILSGQGPELEAGAIADLEETSIKHEDAVVRAAEADLRLSEARMAAKDADAALSVRKEDRARLLAEVKASQEATQELTREILNRLSCEPSALHKASGLNEGEDPADLSTCEARVQRLTRERDAIGVVNLLAEKQVEEVEQQLGTANKQRDELREAVKRLRGTIAEFDREARERLTESFALIDGFFRELFTKLFTGGHAHLSLSGSEDILEAGLEIFACPPGKKLQTMSLMSGGEQALTALALVFAAFLIRPAPVCVLDEVDAALDDANIDRFCSMIEDLAGKNTTRFLVITHRELTMSRCHRLFGVTMMEKGVSKLTSLDMEAAIRLVQE